MMYRWVWPLTAAVAAMVSTPSAMGQGGNPFMTAPPGVVTPTEPTVVSVPLTQLPPTQIPLAQIPLAQIPGAQVPVVQMPPVQLPASPSTGAVAATPQPIVTEVRVGQY